MTRDEVLTLLRAHKDTLAQRFGVTHLALFGSYARDQATQASDVDILARFDGPMGSKRLFEAQAYLEDLLGHPVDLATEKTLRQEVRPYVQAEAIDLSKEGMPMPDTGSQPTREWRFYVEDMIESCGRVLEYTSGLDQAAFVTDMRTRYAVMHNLTLMGKAATNVPKAVREADSQIPWGRIAKTGNDVIHRCWSIDDDATWDVIHEYIPRLLPRLKALLAGHGCSPTPAAPRSR